MSGGMGLNSTFNRTGNGGGAFQFGGKPKLKKVKVQNEGVLYGLKVQTGTDFRFDQDAWRQWHVDAFTPDNITLRRDRE